MNRFTIIVPFLVFICSHAAASSLNVSFDTFNSPSLDVVSSSSVVQDSGPVTSGFMIYESITGTGSFELNADLGFAGITQIHGVTITTNSNGSLHLDGLVTFDMAPSTDYHLFGDISVDYNYDSNIDVTTFTYRPTVFNNSGVEGLLMDLGPFAGSFLDFQVTSTLLAYVDNPYPIYAPVPLPAALWLFCSGILGLIGISRHKKTAQLNQDISFDSLLLCANGNYCGIFTVHIPPGNVAFWPRLCKNT